MTCDTRCCAFGCRIKLGAAILHMYTAVSVRGILQVLEQNLTLLQLMAARHSGGRGEGHQT